MKLSVVASILLLLAGANLAAPQQSTTLAQEPKPDTAKPTMEEKPADAPAPVDPRTYQIGAEDVLRIQIWRENEMSGLTSVRPDGKITMPLMGDVEAWNQTPEQLAARIKKIAEKHIKYPEVTVYVMQVRSKKYYISGKSNRTGEFALVVPTTVMEALSKAGGFQDFANKKKVRIIRGTKRFLFNYDEYVKSGKNANQNILLEPGDHVVVD